VIYAESPAYGQDSWSLIDGRWKVIARADGATLLFDIESDPGETCDLATEKPERRRQMLNRLRSFRQTLLPVGQTDTMPIDKKTEDQLRVLGYLD
jgi:arylsulfatase A-like enzyme